VINEVDIITSEDGISKEQPNKEFIELKNMGSSTIELDSYYIETYDSATNARERIQLPSYNLSPNEHFVICFDSRVRKYSRRSASTHNDILQLFNLIS
jgi:Zn-dependent M28 family amino/carboxypeptidase